MNEPLKIKLTWQTVWNCFLSFQVCPLQEFSTPVSTNLPEIWLGLQGSILQCCCLFCFLSFSAVCTAWHGLCHVMCVTWLCLCFGFYWFVFLACMIDCFLLSRVCSRSRDPSAGLKLSFLCGGGAYVTKAVHNLELAGYQSQTVYLQIADMFQMWTSVQLLPLIHRNILLHILLLFC